MLLLTSQLGPQTSLECTLIRHLPSRGVALAIASAEGGPVLDNARDRGVPAVAICAHLEEILKLYREIAGK